jgi:hypothetical protein
VCSDSGIRVKGMAFLFHAVLLVLNCSDRRLTSGLTSISLFTEEAEGEKGSKVATVASSALSLGIVLKNKYLLHEQLPGNFSYPLLGLSLL